MSASDDGVDSRRQKKHKQLAYDEQEERLRLDRLAGAVLSLPSGSTEYIFAEVHMHGYSLLGFYRHPILIESFLYFTQGCSLLEKGKTTLAFQHLDLWYDCGAYVLAESEY